MTREELERIAIEKPDAAVYARVQACWDGVAKPLDGLGEFERIIDRIGAISGTVQVDVRRKAVLVMCADNGIVEEGVSQSGQEVSAIVTRFMGKNQSSVGKMAAVAGADVIVTDIGLMGDERMEGVRDRKVAHGTNNFLREPAMTEEQTLAAIQIGMDTVRECREAGYRLLGTGEMGIGNTTTSSAVAAALLGCGAEAVAGRGAGLSDAGLARKTEVIRQALLRYRFHPSEAFRILQTVGGLDIAGLVGVCIGGAAYRVPVVIDGLIGAAAALAAERLVPGVRDDLIPSHMGREPAAKLVLRELGMEPVIRAGLALGEGTGAVMLFSLLDMAMALYESRTTFAEIQVEQYERFT